MKSAAEMGLEKICSGYSPFNSNHPEFVKKRRFGYEYEGYRWLFLSIVSFQLCVFDVLSI